MTIITLRGVRNGHFNKRVHVTTNDEIGYAGDVINEMTDGLIEREKMQQSLNLAREVQQNLLPKRNLKVNGIDIAGKSIYCDETGGDYYDFISIKIMINRKLGWLLAMYRGMVFLLRYLWLLFDHLCGSVHLYRAALPRSFPM